MNARRVSSSRKRPAAERRQSRPRPRHVAARARHGLRHARVEVIGVVAVSVAVLLVLAGSVVAYFGATGTDSATGSVGTLAAPTNVVAAQVASTTNVQVTWTTSAGSPVPDGYYVTRTTGVSTANACGSSPANLVTGTSCTDNSVAIGTHTYRVIAVYRTWTATSAPANVNVTAVAAPPVISNIRPATLAFGGSWGAISCATPTTTRICANVSPGAGVITSVTAQMKRASDNQCYDGTGTAEADWTLAACTVPLVMAVSGAPNYSSAALLSSGYAENDTYTFTITATNSTGGTASASTTRTIDTAAPAGTITPTVTNNGSAVTLSATDLIGIASIQYRVDANNPTAFVLVNGPGPVTLPTLAAGSHQIDYILTDNAGRTTAVDNVVVLIDTAPPSVSGLVPATGASGTDFSAVDCNTRRLCATVTDTGLSGIASVTYQLKRASDNQCYDGSGASVVGDWSLAACSIPLAMSGGPTYQTPSILNNNYSAADSYLFTTTASDNAGNTTSASTTFTLAP